MGRGIILKHTSRPAVQESTLTSPPPGVWSPAARNSSSTNKAQLDSATAAFETTFFNNMVLVLDNYFVHRLRTVEGKDGNPLNEVRVMCDSMLQNKNIMTADNSIKLSPAKSVLKIQSGDEIKVKEADFILLSRAFFAEIESKYL